jgi:hypothetical protein
MSASKKRRPTAKVENDLFGGLVKQVFEAVAGGARTSSKDRERAGRPPPMIPKEAREFIDKGRAGKARRKSYQASQKNEFGRQRIRSSVAAPRSATLPKRRSRQRFVRFTISRPSPVSFRRPRTAMSWSKAT